ncbi:MAG: LysM peptidoglycan-binding domain-containing protein [Nibricoccus sp.]
MFKVAFWSAALALVLSSAGHLNAQVAQSLSTEVANLSEDLRGLKQRINELQLRVEQLERQNEELRGKASGSAQSYATVAQLNEAVLELNRTIKTTAATTKNETLQQVSVQMEKLANQTNAALESLANARPQRPAQTTTHTQTQAAFSDDYPKEGITYVVQKGETLAVVARKTGAKQQDIINANKISDPSKIQAGQSLFIPGGK